MNILIRVDSHSEIALGHLNRCINLGISLLKHKNKIFFMCFEDSTSKLILNKYDFDFQLIPYKINDGSRIFDEMRHLLVASQTIDLILVDSYSVDDAYFKMLKNIFHKVIYLDDLGLDFNVDMVINSSCKAKKSDYKAKEVLCGMKYVILRPEYSIGRINNIDLMNNSILVTMGGVDHYNISSRVIKIIEKISNSIEVDILIGPYYDNIDSIKKAASISSLKINILENISNISSIILRNNMAITAGGFTVYEMASMSTPCIAISLWDNQINNVKCMFEEQALIPLYYTNNSKFDKNLEKGLIDLINNDSLRSELSNKGRMIIDGNGADRISRVITQKYSNLKG